MLVGRAPPGKVVGRDRSALGHDLVLQALAFGHHCGHFRIEMAAEIDLDHAIGNFMSPLSRFLTARDPAI